MLPRKKTPAEQLAECFKKELLRELVHDAHSLGLKVVLDLCRGGSGDVRGGRWGEKRFDFGDQKI